MFLDREKKTVLITGAAGGLGIETCRKFSKDSNLVIFDKSERVFQIETELSNVCDILAIQGDLTKEEDVNRVIFEVTKRYGSIDVLVNIAGIFISGSVTELDMNQFKKSLDINIIGTFLICNKVIPIMQQNKGGNIITISSHFGLIGGYQCASYCAAKGAIIQLTKSIALDYSKDKIYANCICPGFMETDMLKEIKSKIGMNRNWLNAISGLPINKVSVEEVAIMIEQVSKTKSMTGSVLTIDGGYTAR
jgi:dihydroanticapsin dehydrogenase